MGAFAAFVVAHGSSLRVLAAEIGVSVHLLEQVDSGNQGLPSDLVIPIQSALGTLQGDVEQAAGKLAPSIDRVGRNARLPAILTQVGGFGLAPTGAPQLLKVIPLVRPVVTLVDDLNNDIVTNTGDPILVGV